MNVQCKKCKKTYRQYIEDQVAGCRGIEFDVCPYCGNINGSSHEEEYDNYPIRDDDYSDWRQGKDGF